MIAGPLETLRASRRLAANSTACPPWCDHQHDLTGDDRGINHGCVLISPTTEGSVEAFLRTREMADAAGTLGPVSLAIFTTERKVTEGSGWYLEIPVDAHLGDIQEAVQRAMGLLGFALPTPDEHGGLPAVDGAVIDLVDRAGTPLIPAG